MQNTATSLTTFSRVNDKIRSVFVCVKRPLIEGEKPKHAGESSIYEATNEIDPAFLTALKAGGDNISVSWKLDGTCCLITPAGNPHKLQYWRRRDIRKGSKAPEGSIMGDIASDGTCNVAWIPLLNSKDPDDACHLSALNDTKTGFWTIDSNGHPSEVLFDSLNQEVTYELLGPKIQNNPYDLPSVQVKVELKKGIKEMPRHYLVSHGAFPVKNFPFEEFANTDDKLTWIREFVITNRVEGLVFRTKDGDKTSKTYFKVNRGHIGKPAEGTKFYLAGLP